MKLTCDLCGGTLEMKNGSAVCQGCGLTYSMETLRKKMGKPAPAAPAPAQAKPAASAGHTNLLNLAKLEFNNKNYAKVITICDQVLASDYSNRDAWQLKIRSSNLKTGTAAYQAYCNSQQTEDGRSQAAIFGKKYFESVKLSQIEDIQAVLPIFPDLANKAANAYLNSNISDWKKLLAEATAAQEWEKRNKPNTEYEYNEKTTEFLSKTRDRVRWTEGTIQIIEDYYSFSKLPGSDVYHSLEAYCEVLESWVDTILNFKRWKGEFHRRETVSVYTTKYYYHKYQLIPLLYDTSWEYDACRRYKATLSKIRSSISAEIGRIVAQKEADKRKKIADYWAAHKEEKEKLENKRNELLGQIARLKQEFEHNEEILRYYEIEEELKNLQTRRNSLGLFKKKEKKELDEQISNKKAESIRAYKRYDEFKFQHQKRLSELKDQIQKINDRFERV